MKNQMQKTNNGRGVSAAQFVADSIKECDDNRELLADIASFVVEILDDPNMSEGRKLSMIAGTVLHDIGGTLNRERCFRPRVSGWSKRGSVAFNSNCFLQFGLD